MNSSIQSIIDSALDGTLSTNSEVEHEASDGFKDSEIVKLAHALDFLGNNLDNIGTDEERLSDLQMLHEKVANETTALARLDPKMANPVGGTAYEAGKATGTKAGASTAGITQAVKNTWQGTGPKWTSAMGGHAGKAALIGGGLLGAGLAGKALFGKEGSYTDPSELSEAELIDYLGYDDAELYVLNKVAGVSGMSLYELMVKKANQFGLDRVMGTINHYASADVAGAPLSESAKNRMVKQLNSAAKNHPGVASTPQYKDMQKLVKSLQVGKPVPSAAAQQGSKIILGFDGTSDLENAARVRADADARAAEPAAVARDKENARLNREAKARNQASGKVTGHVSPPQAGSGAPPKAPTPQAGGAPTPRQVTGQSPRMISGPTTPANPAATKATAAATPFYKNPKVIGGLAAAAGLGLAAKSVFGGDQKKTASYEENDMSVFDEYDFSYLMTKEAKRTGNVPAGQEVMRTAKGRATSYMRDMDPRDYVNQRTRGGVSERVARRTGGRTYNARVAQGRSNYAASGSGPRKLAPVDQLPARMGAKSTAKKSRKAAKALEIGYAVEPQGAGFLKRHGRKLGYGAAGVIGTGALYGMLNDEPFLSSTRRRKRRS